LRNRQVLPSPEADKGRGIGRCMEIRGEELPKSFRLWTPPVEDQGYIGNCVAQSLAAIFEAYEHRVFPGRPHRDFSVGFLYGVDNWNIGMTASGASKTAVNRGDVLREQFECFEENRGCYETVKARKEELCAMAEEFRYFGDYVYLHNIDSVCRFLYRYRIPALITIRNGDHAVAAIGWERLRANEIKLYYLNSYGERFGNKGIGTTESFKEGWGLVPMNNDIVFPDVQKERWSYGEIQEAAHDGVMVGFEDGTFRPEEPVTREQLAVIYSRLKEKGAI